MNKKLATLFTAAIVTGLVTGAVSAQADASKKHDAKVKAGKASCKGKGGCKGKASCKGQEGEAAAEESK